MTSYLTRSPRTLARLALLGLMTVSLPTIALAQDKNPPRNQAPAEETAAPEGTGAAAGSGDFEVSIPTIDAQNANIDEDRLREIFSGNVAGNAEQLASLEADRISIPEIRITYSVPAEGETQTGEMIYRDIEISDVSGGVASSTSVGGATVTNSDGTTMELGEMSSGTFDIGGTLRFYGLVEGDPASEPQVLYEDFFFEGGTLTSAEAECEFGDVSIAEFRARPLTMSFGELMALAERMEAEGENPSPESVTQFVNFYADFLNAFESSPMEFDGFECSGTTEDGKPMQISFGSLEVGGFGQGRYPEITGKDLDITVEEDGRIKLGEFVLKSFDLSGVVATLQGAAGELGDAWFEENVRSIIPPFEGFSFADLSVDVPDEEHPGQRIQLKIGDVDVTLANYVNGVPTDISSSAEDVEIALPEDSEDETVKQLLAMGIDRLDLGYQFAASWDEDAQLIEVDEFSLSERELGSVDLTATMGNAVADLFSNDTNMAMAAAMGLNLRSLSLSAENEGLAQLLLEKTASEQGTDVETLRANLAGTAQGTILVLLAGTQGAEQLAQAVADFVKGADRLSVSVNATDEAGLGLADFEALQSDPSALKGKISIEAQAE